MNTDVLVVGAGPTGLTMANLLARGGVDFWIVDTKTGPVEESRALVMHAKTLELLDKLGLAERAIAEGQPIGEVSLLRHGTPAGSFPFNDDAGEDRTPFPLALIFEQSKSERLLLRGLEEAGGGVEWGTELLYLSPTPAGVRATVRRPDGEEETIASARVVGADGASSRVRRALGLGFEGETYEQRLFLADVDLEWELGSTRAVLNLTTDGFLMYFPMPGDRRFRLIGFLPDDFAGREQLTVDDVQQILDRETGLPATITRARWISVYRTHHRMTDRFRVGPVFLVGDAAHIHSPAGGQGMNTGIGDAYNLGWKLALVATGRAHEALLDSYEAERMPFARAILRGSDRGFEMQATTNPVGQRIKILAVPPLVRLLTSRAGFRRQGFWFLSQLWTRYRDSPAVAESGPVGRLPRAGDRAPFGFFEVGPDAGTSIFAKLASPDHHLLLFDGMGPGPVGMEPTQEEIARLLDRYAATVRLHRVPAENRSLHERYGADRASVFVVRPDGHLAYRGDAADLADLTRYLDRLLTRRGAGASQSGSSRGERPAA